MLRLNCLHHSLLSIVTTEAGKSFPWPEYELQVTVYFFVDSNKKPANNIVNAQNECSSMKSGCAPTFFSCNLRAIISGVPQTLNFFLCYCKYDVWLTGKLVWFCKVSLLTYTLHLLFITMGNHTALIVGICICP